MRASAVAVLVISLTLAIGRLAWAGPKVPDYTGWQVIVTGLEITNSTYHSDLGYTLDDKCTVTKRGTSKYVVKDTHEGQGLDRFSLETVSSSTNISVSGQGRAYFYSAKPALTKQWSYKLGPSDYPADMESFCPVSGGVAQTSPDEPMFMPRMIRVESYVPETEWGVTPHENDSLGASKDVTIAAWGASAGGEELSPLDYVFSHRLDGEHLTASGHRLFSYTPEPIPDVSASSQIEVTYNVVVIPAQNKQKPPRVELADIDRNWWPEKDNSLTAHITVHGDKPAEAFRLTLYGVSKEPGVCCNSADGNTDPDLSFAGDAGGWTVAKDGDGWTATSNEGGTGASLEIKCHDWGAWGKLKGEAEIDGQWEPAKVAGGLNFVRIPYDDDDDHIADSWQAMYEVGGKAAKDDSGKKPTDQANDGDGLSMYECYRGFEVLDGGRIAIDPRQKVLFFLDDSGYFNAGLWEHASGIKAYALGPDMCKPGAKPEAARKVNFRSSYARNGDKYCVPITVVKGLYKDSDGDIPMGLANGPGGGCPGCPREVESLYLYPDNALSWINTWTTRLGIAVAQPNSAEAKDFDNSGLPRQMWKRALDKLSAGYRQQLADQVVRATAIHEMGHCCGLMGH